MATFRNLLAAMSIAVSGLTMAAGISPARADCFEDIGCTDSDRFDVDDLMYLSCENLWYVRNKIYDENGYCFRTDRARDAFDNSDCWVRSQSKVQMSQIERHNVNEIVAAEDEKGCD
jgi:hypothetical protein